MIEDDEFHHTKQRVYKLEKRMDALENSIKENSRITQEVANNTKEMVELFKGMKGMRALVLFVAPAVAAVAAVIHHFKNGG